MIEIVEGVGVGAGKSYYTATRILAHLAEGGSVFASTTFGLLWEKAKDLVEERWGKTLEDGQYQTFPQEDIPRLHEVTPCGSDDCPVLVVVDEAHIELNARDWGDKSKRPFFNWLTQSRHQNTDVIFISQAAANMDKQIARLATRVIRMRNLVGWQIPGIGRWPLRQFVVGTYDRDGKTLQNRRFIWHDNAVFRVYDSKVMRSAHKRAEGIVPRRKLKRSTKKNPMYIKIFLLIVTVAVVVTWKTWDKNPVPELLGWRQPKVKSTASAPVSAPMTAATIVHPPSFEIRRETLRAAIGNDYLRTDDGTYEPGVMSVHGLVVGIRDNVVKIYTPDRRTVFVIPHGVKGPETTPLVASNAPLPAQVVENQGHRAAKNGVSNAVPSTAQVVENQGQRAATPAPAKQIAERNTPKFRTVEAYKLRQ